jgi:hypothetical protein
MRIAFDLDGTIVPAPGSPMTIERLGLVARLISREHIREGTPRLLKELRRQGHGIWLYTTSLRSPARLRVWFASFGVRLDGIVNHARHRAVMAETSVACSKYPPAFGIDLLIDDAEGVTIEGEHLGFAVFRVAEDDASWCSRILRRVHDAESRKAGGETCSAHPKR